MYINITTFNKYYNMLLINYRAKRDEKQLKVFYEALKDFSEKELYEAIIKTMRVQKYFPNIQEIVANVPHTDKDKLQSWESIKADKLSEEDEEYQEMKKLMEQFK